MSDLLAIDRRLVAVQNRVRRSRYELWMWALVLVGWLTYGFLSIIRHELGISGELNLFQGIAAALQWAHVLEQAFRRR